MGGLILPPQGFVLCQAVRTSTRVTMVTGVRELRSSRGVAGACCTWGLHNCN